MKIIKIVYPENGFAAKRPLYVSEIKLRKGTIYLEKLVLTNDKMWAAMFFEDEEGDDKFGGGAISDAYQAVERAIKVEVELERVRRRTRGTTYHSF